MNVLYLVATRPPISCAHDFRDKLYPNLLIDLSVALSYENQLLIAVTCRCNVVLSVIVSVWEMCQWVQCSTVLVMSLWAGREDYRADVDWTPESVSPVNIHHNKCNHYLIKLVSCWSNHVTNFHTLRKTRLHICSRQIHLAAQNLTQHNH